MSSGLHTAERSKPSSGAAGFYEQHAHPSFIEACYRSAPARIRRALAAEIELLRRVLGGRGRALEVGCGTGRLLEQLGDCVSQWVGLDFLPSYLVHACAQRRLAATTVLTAGRGEQLPFADRSFDAVLCAQSTLGLMGKQKQAVLREAARVLRLGGRGFFVVYSERSVVARVEWYAEMHRRGMMAAIAWSRSTPELLLTEDGHASECFPRGRLEELFRQTGWEPRIEPLGELYWVVQAEPSST